MAKLVRNWELAPGEAIAKPGLIPPEPRAGAVDANPGQAGRCLAPLPGVCTVVLGRPRNAAWQGEGIPAAGGDEGGAAGQGTASRLGSTARGAPGLGQSPAWKHKVRGLRHAWAHPRFVYSFSLLFCLTIYSCLPFSHGGCVYLARLAWSPPGSRAAAELSRNPGVASAAMGAPR